MTAPPASSRARRFVGGLLVSICFAVLTNFVSSSLHPRFEHRPESIDKELAILAGESYVIGGERSYWPEFQNRILFASVLGTVAATGIASASHAYQLLRFVGFVAAFLAVWYLMTGPAAARAGPKTAAAAVGVLAYTMVLQFNHGWEHPTDFLDPFFFTLFVGATVTRQRLRLLLLVVLACFSRESAVFAGVIWFAVHGVDFGERRLRPADMAFGTALSVMAYVLVIGVRYLGGGARALHVAQHVSFSALPSIFRQAATHPSLVDWPVLLVAIYLLPALWLAVNRRHVRWIDLQLLAAAGAIFLISNVFSFVSELRMLMPATTVVVLVAALLEARTSAVRADGVGEPGREAAGSRRDERESAALTKL